MNKGLVFWIIMVVAVVFQVGVWQAPDRMGRYGWAGGFVVFVLLALLGWQVFGAAIK
jgi:hypothetical protein